MRFRAIILAIVSPTRAIIDYRKSRSGAIRAEVLQKWNLRWFGFEVAAFLSLCLMYLWMPTWAISGYDQFLLYICLWLGPFSRCNEITYAFYVDSLDKLREVTKPAVNGQQSEVTVPVKPSGIVLVDRIRMLIRSYAGLTLNFAFISFFLPSYMYDTPVYSPVDALYFSGVTIATLGYGDIKPIHEISKLLAVYEVFSGILLVVLALAVYVSRPPAEAA